LASRPERRHSRNGSTQVEPLTEFLTAPGIAVKLRNLLGDSISLFGNRQRHGIVLSHTEHMALQLGVIPNGENKDCGAGPFHAVVLTVR
jgi:hypothetical protein